MRRALVALPLLLGSLPARADMFQDASNAAQATTSSGVAGPLVNLTTPFTTTDIGTLFTDPRFGGNLKANVQVKSEYNNSHIGASQNSVLIGNLSSGSGGNGLTANDNSLFIYAGHKDYLTNTLLGEHNAIWAHTVQGINGDGGVYTGGVHKVLGGTNGGYLLEGTANWVKTDGTIAMRVAANVAQLTAPGSLPGATGVGFKATNVGPDTVNAATQIIPYAAFFSEISDNNATCPANCPYWDNLMVAVDERSTNANRIYFQIKSGLTASGDIVMGSGGPLAQDLVTPTQSGGTRLTLQNVAGTFRVLGGDGVTPAWTWSQGSNPQMRLRSTTVPITAGGLWRGGIDASTGAYILQSNTAAGGDFTTANLAWQAMPTGDILTSTSTAIATNSTSKFIYVATMAGAPTGVPVNASAGRTAVVWDSTNKKLCAYNQPTSAWACSAAFTP